MSQGDTKVSNANVVDHIDSYDELVSRLASMNIALENEMAKTSKLENENSFLNNTCEQQKHLLYVISCSHEELKLAHEELALLIITWYKTMLFTLKSFQMKNLKLVRAHHMGQLFNHMLLLTLVT